MKRVYLVTWQPEWNYSSVFITIRLLINGRSMFIDFDVTMATNFLQAGFSDGTKNPLGDKLQFLTVTLKFVAHICVPLFVLITFSLFSVLSCCFGEIQKSKMVELRWPPFGNNEGITTSFDANPSRYFLFSFFTVTNYCYKKFKEESQFNTMNVGQ